MSEAEPARLPRALSGLTLHRAEPERWNMCESSVFIRRNGGEELLAEDVARVVPEGDQIRVITLLGEEHRVAADLVEIDLMSHRILLQERKS